MISWNKISKLIPPSYCTSHHPFKKIMRGPHIDWRKTQSQMWAHGLLWSAFPAGTWRGICGEFSVIWRAKGPQVSGTLTFFVWIIGKSWPWGAGHFATLGVTACQMPRYVPARDRGAGGGAGGYIDWCITLCREISCNNKPSPKKGL